MPKGKKGKKSGPGRSKSSERWLTRQRKDPFIRQAADEGKISRAYYKLSELDGRFVLLRSTSWVLELGAAPGGWTQYIESKVRDGAGGLIACDSRAIQAAAETHVVKGAFGEPWVTASIQEVLAGARLDLVLSDMAPSITGVRATDQARAMNLAEMAVEAGDKWLKPGGQLVVKMFQGEGFDAFVAEVRKKYAKFRVVKPTASRAESREVYAVGQQFLANG